MRLAKKPAENFETINLGDKRLNERLKVVTEHLTKKPGQSIYGASGSRGGAKAAYRLLANENLTTEKVLESVTQTTVASIAESAESENARVLLIQDTAEINLSTHTKTEGLGYCNGGVKGLKVHTCLAVSTDGIPVGIMSQSALTRTEEAPERTKREETKRPIEEKESFCWLETIRETTSKLPQNVEGITVCDRECDFYEFYDDAGRLNAKFVVRLINNRVTESGEKVLTAIHNAGCAGEAVVSIPRDTRNNVNARGAKLKVYFSPVTLNKPVIRKEDHIAKQLTLNIVRIVEEHPPKGISPIEWTLATNLPIQSLEDAMQIVRYYVLRWKIERFHFVLKSGCKVEEIQQRSVERIKPLLVIYSVIAAFIMAITLSGREYPDMPCDAFFDKDEWQVLYCAANRTPVRPLEPYPISEAVEYLGILGGYKNAPCDGKIGVKAVWLGLFALFVLLDFSPFVGQA